MFHVGLLYSCQDLLIFLNGTRVHYKDFIEAFRGKFGIAPGQNVIELSQRCNWVEVDLSGLLNITTRGNNVLNTGSYTQALRRQLSDMINIIKPTWSRLIPKGRKEFTNYLDPDTLQCFREAGLLESLDDDIINWWDTISLSIYQKTNELLSVTGRKAEKLTINYEKKRTGKEPEWKSIDTNLCGYDILSSVSKSDSTPLNIEVKGTTQNNKGAKFYLSSFEWKVATSSHNYLFYLWTINNPRKPIIKSVAEVAKHIPKNLGLGKWDTVEIPFSI